MKRLFAFAVFFALFFHLLFPACPTAQRSIFLAGVVGESNGGVFQLQVEVKPGSGTTYTAVNPRTGIATQESEELASKYAFSSSGMDRRECDVLFRFVGDFGQNTIDGPSAGGAMAAAIKAALLNKTIRQDVVMTGTVSADGKVGAVGGIIEKGIASAKAGAKYFITPKLMVHEAILLSSLSRNMDFHAIDVESLAQAEEILFSDYSRNFSSNYTPSSKPIPANLPKIGLDAELGRFALISAKVVSVLEQKVSQAYPAGRDTPETAKLHSYFLGEIEKYKKLLSSGYLFTAANSAFLLSIDVEFAKIGDAQVDLNGSISDVSSCISSLSSPQKTRENLQWAIGADLRRIWATSRLNQTLEAREDQGGYTTLRDLLYSSSWCGISRELSLQAQEIGGTPINESLLSSLASKRLAEAKEKASSSKRIDYDVLWHLQNAEEANKSGNYGAAIFETAYVMAMQEASAPGNISEAAQNLASQKRSSLWGKIYAGHGMYLLYDAQASGFPPEDAYKILLYAKELDKAEEEMMSALEEKSQPQQQSPILQTPRSAFQFEGFLMQILLAVCVLLALIIAMRRMGKMKERMVK